MFVRFIAACHRADDCPAMNMKTVVCHVPFFVYFSFLSFREGTTNSVRVTVFRVAFIERQYSLPSLSEGCDSVFCTVFRVALNEIKSADTCLLTLCRRRRRVRTAHLALPGVAF
ncbi:unnamed protein product [Polarella glacialis]|uniref:Uncharacterized protein n=1 Tax=Polarella glacialis TaxID=89957 RepID=A0A813LPR9_POLGL|nr:unnamed protein product [Polarella glacialis]